VNVRNTLVCAPTGELFTVPNGEIGVVRNFSRANLSAPKIKLNVAAADCADLRAPAGRRPHPKRVLNPDISTERHGRLRWGCSTFLRVPMRPREH
jgi:hypothetical protein